MSPLLIVSVAAFLGVSALVGGIGLLIRNPGEKVVEDRLDVLAGRVNNRERELATKEKSVLARPLDDVPNAVEEALSRVLDVRRLLEQAALKISPTQFFLVTIVLTIGSGVAVPLMGWPIVFAPVAAICAGVLPLMVVLFLRSRRAKAFARQLPEAMDLISRALRAGHSLGSGFHLVQQEMPAPLGPEFGRVYEEQNLGISMEDALDNLANRVNNLDLRFFATAVILQRTTGGDLAEILDKIGHLIRERFKIFGQIQALTGEGRLSGIVLLALPPVLALVMYRLNPDYLQQLFEDPMGQQMLAGAIFLQLLGALVIKKIVSIKV
ncbi:MAG: type II secretion system F family protein [Pirellulales bacterium]